jgi:uncharacterized protein
VSGTATASANRRAEPTVAASTTESTRLRQQQTAPWPYRSLDIKQLRAQGWRPTPIRELVLKVHQRCNLACDYCFVYTGPDQSWRDRPVTMSDEIWRAAVANLGRHVRRHGLHSVRLILHGGEPLLLGPARLVELAADARASLPADCMVHIGVQTNGVLLNARMMAALRQHGISVGVSVDGTAQNHDRHRLRRNGRGSFAAVRTAIDLLRQPENRGSYGGLLCTVSPQTDPIECYDQLAAFDPPTIDFLIPHANWKDRPPPSDDSQTPIAEWLIAAFDRWYDTPDGIRVRLFEDIIALLLGSGSRSEQVGLSPTAVAVVESDGAIEQVDSLKSTYAGACATGLDVRRDELDAVLADPGFVARQIGMAAMAAECSTCPVVRVCGGGHYAHRYNPANGFRNPSVYCADMSRLIGHINRRLWNDPRLPLGGQAR